MRGTRKNPWRWMTDGRLTYLLKCLMILVLILYVGQFVIEILTRIRGVIYVLIASIFLAYLIFPAAQWLRRRMGLVAAIVVIYATMLGTLAVAMLFIAPHVIENVEGLGKQFPLLVARLHDLIFDPRNPVTSRLPVWVREGLAGAPNEIAKYVTGRSLAAFGHVITVLEGTLAILAVFVIVPMVTAYLLLDLEHLKRSLAAIVPEERWRTTLGILADIDGVIGGFIRGQSPWRS